MPFTGTRTVYRVDTSMRRADRCSHVAAASPHRPLLAGGSAALGVLVGGFLGLNFGLWFSDLSGSPGSDSTFFEALGELFEVISYVWAGTLIGALLCWLATPLLLGLAKKWPKNWLALGVQVVVGIALWLIIAFMATALDLGGIGLLLVGLVILGSPAAGRWFVERSYSQAIPTTTTPH